MSARADIVAYVLVLAVTGTVALAGLDARARIRRRPPCRGRYARRTPEPRMVVPFRVDQARDPGEAA